jgi:hypothetical protein
VLQIKINSRDFELPPIDFSPDSTDSMSMGEFIETLPAGQWDKVVNRLCTPLTLSWSRIREINLI